MQIENIDKYVLYFFLFNRYKTYIFNIGLIFLLLLNRMDGHMDDMALVALACSQFLHKLSHGNKISIARSHVSRRAARTWKPNLRSVRAVIDGETKKNIRMFKMFTFWKSYKSIIYLKIKKIGIFCFFPYFIFFLKNNFMYYFSSFIPNTNLMNPLKNFGTF